MEIELLDYIIGKNTEQALDITKRHEIGCIKNVYGEGYRLMPSDAEDVL